MKRIVDAELTKEQFEELTNEIDIWSFKTPEDVLRDELRDIRELESPLRVDDIVCDVLLQGRNFFDELMERVAVLKVDGEIRYVRTTADEDVLEVIQELFYPDMTYKEFYDSTDKEVIDDGVMREKARESVEPKEEKEKNAGFIITERVDFGENVGFVQGIVMGEREDGTEFVTWLKNDRGYDQGHYFNTREKAFVDMMERACSVRGIDLEEKYRVQSEKEEIKEVLYQFLGEDEVYTLLRNDDFVQEVTEIIDQRKDTFVRDEVRLDVETIYKDMIQEGKVFPEFLKANLASKNIAVSLKKGEYYEGKMQFLNDENFVIDVNNQEGLSGLLNFKDIQTIADSTGVIYEKGKDVYSMDVSVLQGKYSTSNYAIHTDVEILKTEIYRDMICDMCRDEDFETGEFTVSVAFYENGIEKDYDEFDYQYDKDKGEVDFERENEKELEDFGR